MRKNIAREILLLTFLASIIFAALEFSDPFFFLQDDNQNSYLYVYKYSFDALTHGDIAFYNFHQFLGLSFFSTGQTGTLNPLVIISCLISKLIFIKTC